MQHLEEGIIHAWLDGALSPDEAADVERHMAQCAACGALVAEARGMIAGASRIIGALDVVPGGVIPKQTTRAAASGSLWRSLRFTPLRAALAASLMIAAASLMVAKNQKSTATDAGPSTSQPTVVAPVAAPLPASTAAPRLSPSAVNAPVASAPTVASASPAADASRAAAVPPVAKVASGAGAAQRVLRERSSLETRELPRPKSIGAITEVVMTGLTQTTGTSDSVAGATNAQAQRRETAMLSAAAASAARSNAAPILGAVADRLANDSNRQRFAPTLTSSMGRDFIGCYQVGPEVRTPENGLPERFALAQTSVSGPARSLVLAVDSAGRPDSAMIGTWSPVSGNAVSLTLVSAVRRPLVVLLAGNGATAPPAVQAQAANSSAPRVIRSNCRR